MSLPESPKVLFLDDELEVLKAIERELRGFFHPILCTTLSEALKSFKSEDVTVVVSDLRMPEINGLDFLTQCRQVKPEVPRMLLTAFADLADLGQAVNGAQLSRILSKPWNRNELLASLDDLSKIYELFLENQILRTLSLTDSLTGLANHRYFWERLEAEFSRGRRFKRSLSLVMADVDNFKTINDTEGHPRGDFILKQVAQILSNEKRNMDTIARYGGEEFALILPEADAQQAAEIARRRLESLKRAKAPTMSFGVAELDASCADSKDLYARADKALYQSKHSGKARVSIWSPE
jgi:two-component system cell cycle response regulator